jgi:hypothetical protein
VVGENKSDIDCPPGVDRPGFKKSTWDDGAQLASAAINLVRVEKAKRALTVSAREIHCRRALKREPFFHSLPRSRCCLTMHERDAVGATLNDDRVHGWNSLLLVPSV